MNIFRCSDTDGGRESLIVAHDLLDCIALFKEYYGGSDPEIIRNLSANQEIVIMHKDFLNGSSLIRYWKL